MGLSGERDGYGFPGRFSLLWQRLLFASVCSLFTRTLVRCVTSAPGGGRARWTKKIENFWPGQARCGIVIFRTPRELGFSIAARRLYAQASGNDSLIAPQTIEIAQNGLANFAAALASNRQRPAQDETGRLAAAARRFVAPVNHRWVEALTRGERTLRTRAW
jgi:hypothetical protein